MINSLAAARHGLTLQELSDDLGVPVGSMHRLLAVLAEERFVGRSPTNRRYFLGPALLEIARHSGGSRAILQAPHPALAAAGRQTGETVFTTQLIGDRAICVDLVEARHPLRLFVRVGQEMPLHAAASARAVLTDLSDDDIRYLLAGRDLPSFTPRTPTRVNDVLDRVATARERGYDTCEDELDHDVWAVAVPVQTSTGRIVASVTLAAPAARASSAAVRDRALGAVQVAAATVSADLGFPGEASLPPSTVASTGEHAADGWSG